MSSVEERRLSPGLRLDLLVDVSGIAGSYRMVADVAQLDPGLLVAHDESPARLEHAIDRRDVHRHPLFRGAVGVRADLDENRGRRHLPRAGEPERPEPGFAVRPGN